MHFDTWRLNMRPGIWLPAYIYSEDQDMPGSQDHGGSYKAETRIWGYNVGKGHAENEFTEVLVDDASAGEGQQRQGPGSGSRWRPSAPGSARPKTTWSSAWNAAACWPRPAKWTRCSTRSSTTLRSPTTLTFSPKSAAAFC